MTWSPSSPITGGAQTGLTSPTYTLTQDVAPNAQGKQHAVTTLGGTQTGVRTHSASDPFTITFERPAVIRTAPIPNSVTGLIGPAPRNVYKLRVRKGVVPVTGQAAQIMLCTLTMEVPAGADVADPANIRAALSLLFGAASAGSSGVGDSAVTGII